MHVALLDTSVVIPSAKPAPVPFGQELLRRGRSVRRKAKAKAEDAGTVTQSASRKAKVEATETVMTVCAETGQQAMAIVSSVITANFFTPARKAGVGEEEMATAKMAKRIRIRR